MSLNVNFIWPHCRQFCESPLIPFVMGTRCGKIKRWLIGRWGTDSWLSWTSRSWASSSGACPPTAVCLALSSGSTSWISSCPWCSLVRDSEVEGCNRELWRAAHRCLKRQTLHSLSVCGAAPSESAYHWALIDTSQAMDALFSSLGVKSRGYKACWTQSLVSKI